MGTSDGQGWREIFPYEPYEQQITGIQRVRETLSNGGIQLIEGPCGSGKTLMSLCAGLSLVQGNSQYSRILVITSKKQQLSAFEDDMEEINAQDGFHFPALSLVGKPDVCPYVEAGTIEAGDIYGECFRLRDNTREIADELVESGAVSNKHRAASILVNHSKKQVAHRSDALHVDQTLTDHPEQIPEGMEKQYCPFYASHIINMIEERSPLNVNEVTSGQEILQTASACGTCPHMEMRRLFPSATVVIGNYQHVFDPRTVRGVSGSLFDDSTLLIVDEAHEIVSRTREQLSYELPYATLEKATDELREMHQLVMEDSGVRGVMANQLVDKTQLQKDEFEAATRILGTVRKVLSASVVQRFNTEHSVSIDEVQISSDSDPIDVSVQYTDDRQIDPLKRWVANGREEKWKRLLAVLKITGAIKGIIRKRVDDENRDGTYAVERVYRLLENWWVGGDKEYFRDVQLYPRQRTNHTPAPHENWRQTFRARLRLHNTLPRGEIASTLSLFGGSIIMSATLSPLEVYMEETGIDLLRDGSYPDGGLVKKAVVEKEKDEEGDENTETIPDVGSIGELEGGTSSKYDDKNPINVDQVAFPLAFPEKNRLSRVVELPRFTYENRETGVNADQVRASYARTVADAVQSIVGNVMVAMPSYSEARWIADELRSRNEVSSDVLVDKSSTDAETEELKSDFFAGNSKILATSLRGTLVEGVDYDGDKLAGVIVCGLPIEKMGTDLSKARKDAYDEQFDNKGYEYGFAVPAVRKTRQALGRVIRGEDEVGVRLLIDERYCLTGGGGVQDKFPDYAVDEFQTLPPESVSDAITDFFHDKRT